MPVGVIFCTYPKPPLDKPDNPAILHHVGFIALIKVPNEVSWLFSLSPNLHSYL